MIARKQEIEKEIKECRDCEYLKDKYGIKEVCYEHNDINAELNGIVATEKHYKEEIQKYIDNHPMNDLGNKFHKARLNGLNDLKKRLFGEDVSQTPRDINKCNNNTCDCHKEYRLK